MAPGTSAATSAAGQGERGFGLLCLHGLLERPRAFAAMVVDVPRAVGMGWVPDDTESVLDCFSEPARRQSDWILAVEDRG